MGKERMTYFAAGLLLSAGSFLAGESIGQNIQVEKTEVPKPSIFILDTNSCGKIEGAPTDIYEIDPSIPDDEPGLITEIIRPDIYIFYNRETNQFVLKCGDFFYEENPLSTTTTHDSA